MCKKLYPLLILTLLPLGALTKKESSLHEAAGKGDAKKMKALLSKWNKKKDNIDAIGSEKNKYTETSGWTALYLAGTGGHTEVVKMLIKAGANPAGRTDKGFGDTSCFLADVLDKPEIVELFLKAKAASACPDLLFHSRTSQEFASKLLEGGLSANATLEYAGNAPLLVYAVQEDRADLVKLLILHKADVNFKYRTEHFDESMAGKSILDIAIPKNNAEIIQLLKEAGAK